MNDATTHHPEDRRDVTFRVHRFNPQVDAKSYFSDYTIKLAKGVTVLRALNHIKEHVDPTLTFRAFCHAGICGSCAMRINSMSKLACTTQVWDELEHSREPGVIRVEPLRNLPLVRDLVVEMDPMVARMQHYTSWVCSRMPEEQWGIREFLISQEEFGSYDKATDCILCASCISECTILRGNRSYVSPAILLKSYRMNADSRDDAHQLRLASLVQANGIWDCTHCYRCQESCVKHIPIMDAIHAIREDAVGRRAT